METEKLCIACMRPIGGQDICMHCGASQNLPTQQGYLASGTILRQRYLLGRVLRHSDRAAVYIAYDYISQRRVAVREYFPTSLFTRLPNGPLMQPAAGVDPEECQHSLARYRREILAFQMMRPTAQCIQVLDTFDANNTVYWVSDEQDDLPLETYLAQQGGKLGLPAVQDIGFPLGNALKAMHADGLLHLGVSPETILMGPAGNLRFCDLGNAYLPGGPQPFAARLATGYAAPEQYQPGEKTGAFTDIYGFGALLYRMYVGAPPRSALERETKAEKMLPARFAAQLPAYFASALERALSMSPQKRYKSMDAFLAALTGVGASGRKTIQKRRLGKPRWGLIVASLFLLLAGVGCIEISKALYTVAISAPPPLAGIATYAGEALEAADPFSVVQYGEAGQTEAQIGLLPAPQLAADQRFRLSVAQLHDVAEGCILLPDYLAGKSSIDSLPTGFSTFALYVNTKYSDGDMDTGTQLAKKAAEVLTAAQQAACAQSGQQEDGSPAQLNASAEPSDQPSPEVVLGVLDEADGALEAAFPGLSVQQGSHALRGAQDSDQDLLEEFAQGKVQVLLASTNRRNALLSLCENYMEVFALPIAQDPGAYYMARLENAWCITAKNIGKREAAVYLLMGALLDKEAQEEPILREAQAPRPATPGMAVQPRAGAATGALPLNREALTFARSDSLLKSWLDESVLTQLKVDPTQIK